LYKEISVLCLALLENYLLNFPSIKQ